MRPKHAHGQSQHSPTTRATVDSDILRCPTEYRLTHSTGPWKCRVSLRKETDERGRRIAITEDAFGTILLDKSKLEDRLRRAQLAILNPSLPMNYFLNFDISALKDGEKPPLSARQLAISSNVVCLDVEGPELTDFSFVDLPGKTAFTVRCSDD